MAITLCRSCWQQNATRSFWARVQKGPECWNWTGSTNGGVADGANGWTPRYGVFVFRGTTQQAHRFAWELFNGPIADGLVVRHRCDNGLCVRPDHLELGTQKENVADAWGRGRMTPKQGQDHGMAKLSLDDVVEIRALCPSGAEYEKLARRFGVHRDTIWKAATGRTWSHLP